MTDQETLNKLFDAALKAPEPEPTRKPLQTGPPPGSSSAAKIAEKTQESVPEPQAKAEPKPEPAPEPQAKAEPKAEPDPVAEDTASEDQPKPGFFKRMFGKS